MHPGIRSGLVALALLTAGAGAGYWAGHGSLGSRGFHGDGPAEAGKASGPARQPLYYRNPMGLPDTSPVPKKDPMGMDYIPVYADEVPAQGGAGAQGASSALVAISPEKIQALGVRTEPATWREMAPTLRAAGRVEVDERRMHAIAPKFEGYVERLHVAVTGQPVAKGQALFDVYSPELVSAQREYAIATQGRDAPQTVGSEARAGMAQLAEASLARLRNWDIPESQVQALASSGTPRRSLTLHAPVSGIVTEKKALPGLRFMPGETLYQVADLSSVWVVADLAEQDLAGLRVGARAQVRVDAYPGQVLTGKVAYIYPLLKGETRTVPVRVELPNPGTRLMPGMFAQVELTAPAIRKALAVPESAVIDSGRRQVVLVRVGEGRFAPRSVSLGARSQGYVEVREGLQEGEAVVVAANFLIDAESNLKAALSGLGSPSAAKPSGEGAAHEGGHGGVQGAAQGGTLNGPGAGNGVVSGAGNGLGHGVGHRAEGTVDAVEAATGTVTLTHGPVASLKWPAMTMDFLVANSGLLPALKPGAKVDFEFVARGQGEWVITAVTPKPSAHDHGRH